MTRAPFLVIDGKLYRWKDILELRRAQLAVLPVCCLHHLFDASPLGLTQQCQQALLLRSGGTNPVAARYQPGERRLALASKEIRGLFYIPSPCGCAF